MKHLMIDHLTASAYAIYRTAAYVLWALWISLRGRMEFFEALEAAKIQVDLELLDLKKELTSLKR